MWLYKCTAHLPTLGSTTDWCPQLWPLWTHHTLALWPCFPGATPSQTACTVRVLSHTHSSRTGGPPLRHFASGTPHWQGWTFLRAALHPKTSYSPSFLLFYARPDLHLGLQTFSAYPCSFPKKPLTDLIPHQCLLLGRPELMQWPWLLISLRY